jgi:hypothetical protein
VDLTVDQARQQVLAREIDDFRAGRHWARPDALDSVVANENIGRDGPPFVD